MRLGGKLRYLREVEGTLRGLGRAMTQQEIVRSIKKDLGKTISQSYLSQIESGARPHLTNSTRMLLARFFNVHPGYLVDDPEGYSTELISEDRKSTRLNSSHTVISYAVFCLKKKKKDKQRTTQKKSTKQPTH